MLSQSSLRIALIAALFMVGWLPRACAVEESWSALNSETLSLYQKREYAKAVPIAEKALQVAETTFGSDHPHVAASLNNLAALYQAQGRYADAEPLYKQALAIDENLLGPVHPVVLSDRNNLEELHKASASPKKSSAWSGSGHPVKPLPSPLPEKNSLSDRDLEESEEPQKRIQATGSVSAGYRQDDVNWTIAGNIGGQSPNILSELKWNNLEIYQFQGRGRVDIAKWAALRGTFDYGWVFNGSNQDSDYLGNNRTSEFSRSNNNSDQGSVVDLSAGIGYPFRFLPDSYDLRVTPLGGYSYHEQNLTITDGFQTIPRTGSFGGLDSEYQTRWRMPWVGLDLSLKSSPKFTFFGTAEYHWGRYQGTGRWNLRTDFSQPKSFRHRAIAKGITGSLGVAYALTKRWDLFTGIEVQKWHTDPGIDTTFFSDGTTSDTRFNRANWNSFYVNFGSTYSF